MMLGIPRTTFSRLLQRDDDEYDDPQEYDEHEEDKERRVGRTLEEFRATYDRDTIVTSRIRSALDELGDGWEYEVAFARLAGVSLGDLAAYREMFAEHIVHIRRDGKRAWTGCTHTAQIMREMVA